MEQSRRYASLATELVNLYIVFLLSLDYRHYRSCCRAERQRGLFPGASVNCVKCEGVWVYAAL